MHLRCYAATGWGQSSRKPQPKATRVVDAEEAAPAQVSPSTTTTTTPTSQPESSAQPSSWFSPTTPISESERTEATYNALTPRVRSHMFSVYSTLTATVGLASIGTMLPTLVPALAISPLFSFVGTIGMILGIAFTPREYLNVRRGLLGGIGLTSGLSLAPLILATQAVAPGAVLGAFIGTTAIFAGFTALSLFAKRQSMLTWGGPLFGGLIGIIGLQLAGWLLPLPAAALAAIHSINLYGGLAIFSAYIGYDTQLMIEKAKAAGENATEAELDPVSDALSLFLDALNVFVRLLSIFRGSDEK